MVEVCGGVELCLKVYVSKTTKQPQPKDCITLFIPSLLNFGDEENGEEFAWHSESCAAAKKR